MATTGKDARRNPSPVLTAAETAEYFKIDRSTVYRLVKTGQIPHFRVGRDYRFNLDAIDAWRMAEEHSKRPRSQRGRKLQSNPG